MEQTTQYFERITVKFDSTNQEEVDMVFSYINENKLRILKSDNSTIVAEREVVITKSN